MDNPDATRRVQRPAPDVRAGLAGVWRRFAAKECRSYSPLYERVCLAVADDDDVLDLVVASRRSSWQPNVLLAAVHHLLLGGARHPLADVYRTGDARADVGALFCAFVRDHRDPIAELLATRHTNTNECGRAAVVAPALRWVADHLGEPLALVDVGASAGLNLNLDRYHLDYGEHGQTGPADSHVRIRCDVTGAPPITTAVPAIAGRIGLDRAPVDLTDPDARRWLLACVWPDTGRLDRTRAAIDLARHHRPRLIAGDMVDDLEEAVESVPADVPLCLVTTWALAYLPEEGRLRFRQRACELSTERSVAWISAEGSGIVDGLPRPAATTTPDEIEPSIVGCMIFEQGDLRSAVTLGMCHPHGAWLHWDPRRD